MQIDLTQEEVALLLEAFGLKAARKVNDREYKEILLKAKLIQAEQKQDSVDAERMSD